MRILILIIVLLWGISGIKAQCQLCYLPEEQAKRVSKFLAMEKEVVLYYSDCKSEVKDIARRLKISKVSYKPADVPSYYEIHLEGVIVGTFDIVNQQADNYVKTEMKFNDPIDIAYLHIRSGGYLNESGQNVWDAICLGIYLGFDCDPCIDPFAYPMLHID
jgi:hypothetical protein